ncbi:MAG: hypothetical protein KatS3mg082_3125 [Nitrospiraceae bacterium]|nr:MAG: hypothetical protein KatS3mg082_3125 [Nitrospiraceae bacterium]
MTGRDELVFWLMLQALVFGWMLRRFCQRRAPSTGFPLAYVWLTFFGGWLPGLVHALPWYASRDVDLAVVEARYGFLAVALFAIGCHLGSARSGRRDAPAAALHKGERRGSPDYGIFGCFAVTGLVTHFALLPAFLGTPTVTAVLSSGAVLFMAGLLGAWWVAALNGDQKRSGLLWMVAALAVPVTVFLSIAVTGFFGFGYLLFATLLALSLRARRLRAREAVTLPVLLFAALSFYQTYMRDRPLLRGLTWAGAPYSVRLSQLWTTFTSPEWFDPFDAEHLAQITGRLGQGTLFGRVVQNLKSGFVEYAGGETLVSAAYALVPRAVWPEKPLRAGGHELVARYSGLRFDENTSVSLGLMFELYVNFGTWGYAVGALLLGLFYGAADRRMWEHGLERDHRRFLVWFALGLSLLSGGEVVTLLPSTVVAVATAHAVSLVYDLFRAPVALAGYRYEMRGDACGAGGDCPELVGRALRR